MIRSVIQENVLFNCWTLQTGRLRVEMMIHIANNYFILKETDKIHSLLHLRLISTLIYLLQVTRLISIYKNCENNGAFVPNERTLVRANLLQ